MRHNDFMPGEFMLHFPELTDHAMYVWVLALGPLDSQGLYSYAITSDPTGTVMWVLARNVTEFNLLYDEEVHVKLEELGFKEGSREPVASYQGSDCEYENIEVMDTVEDLDVDKYYGTYYEMYTDNFVEASWERGTFCSTTTFSELFTSMEGPVEIEYYNFENRGAPNGTAEVVEGVLVMQFICVYMWIVFSITFLLEYNVV
jgi:lipocalin